MRLFGYYPEFNLKGIPLAQVGLVLFIQVIPTGLFQIPIFVFWQTSV